MPISTDDQKVLKGLIERRHPEYHANVLHWDFCEATYNGGRAWFQDNIHKYIKEGGTEFSDRKNRAYRFNHTREVVDLIDKYIFKSQISRKQDAPDAVRKFWETATLSGLNIQQYMKMNSGLSSRFGLMWIFVDTTKSEEVKTKADEKKAKVRTYAYTVKPQNILDASFDDLGKPNWVLVRETKRDDEDPATSTGLVRERYRLWMRDAWYLFEARIGEIQQGTVAGATAKPDEVSIAVVAKGDNALGRVPGFPLRHMLGDSLYKAPGLIDDIAYLDKAVANYLSNLDAIIQDQSFSQLVMPAQNLAPAEDGEDPREKLIEMGTKRIFTYDGESGTAPSYIAPDPKQAGVILTVINKIISEIYHTIGAAGERTKQDNAVGIDNSSGVAKAYDFERLNSLLVSKAQSLQEAENELARLVMMYEGWTEDQVEEMDEPVAYAESFDVRSLYDEFAIAEKLVLIEAPDAVRRGQMEQIVEKLFPDLAKALKDEMLTELQSWPKDPIEEAGKLAEATASAAAKFAPEPKPAGASGSSGSATRNAGTQKRQGQVTKDTGKKAA